MFRTGFEHQEAGLQIFGRAIAEGVDEGVHVELFGSAQRFSNPSRVEKSMPAANRIRFFTYFGMQSGEDRAHGAAHAVSQHADLRRRGALLQELHHARR